MADSSHNQHGAPFGYEKRDANLKGVAIVSLAGALFLILSVVFVDDIFVLTKEQIIFDTVLRPESVPLRDLRAREDEVLHSYKQLDSAAGVYQIPIDRAMQLQADEAYRAPTTPQ
jgi:hypothetical protein